MKPVTLERFDTLTLLKGVVAAAVLLPLLLYGGAVWYLRSQANASSALRIERAARVSEEHALKVFETDMALLTRAMDLVGDDSNETVLAREATLHDQLAKMTQGLPQMQGIFVMDASGRMLATDRRHPAPRHIDFSDRVSFVHHRSGGSQPFISDVLTSRAVGELFFDISIRRTFASGQFGGTLSASMAPKYFADFYRELTGNDVELNIALIRADGAVLARWPLAPVASDQSGSIPLRVKLDQPASVTRASPGLLPDGERGLLATRHLKPYGVYVAAWIDDHAINAVWLHQAALLGALMLPVTLGLVLCVRVALLKTRRSLDDAEQLRLEIRQREMVEETLRQAQKLEAMGRLTGGVAHDFNNLLMILSNSLFILQRKFPQVQASSQAGAMERAVAAGAKLTRQLLSFSRRQPFRPEVIRLQERMPQILDLIRPAVGSAIALSGEASPDTAPVEVDTAELELALVNLAINAKDAMPGGGKLQIVARNVPAGVQPTGLAGPLVEVVVADQGQGISEELLKRVFEPFFTTKPPGHGTGLGLAQVYGFCQRAGGTAVVESRVGEGTSVRMYLPARSTGAIADQQASQGEERDLGLRVLLAEDNVDVAGATQAVLEILGCTVRHASTGDEAKKLIDAEAGNFDLLLSDIVMPGTLNGVALARWVRQAHPGLPVVLMSGYSEFVAEAEAERLDVVPKPCTPSALAAAIKKAIENKG